MGFRIVLSPAVVERLNAKVFIVPGSETNIKVTTEKDLALAEYYLSRERESEQ